MLRVIGFGCADDEVILSHVIYLNINTFAQGHHDMSTYKFNITKRHIMQSTDSSPLAPTPETFSDADTEALARRDIDVSVYLDDVLKHTVTLTDAGATLQFDADITAGDHTIKICAPKDPIQNTDICVDKFLVDDTVVVASQYNFNNVIFGTASTLRQMVSPHNSCSHDYIWYGRMVNNDSSLNLDGMFYRPGIVSDLQGEWHFEFTKTASGHIWMTKTGDTDDILFDSTAQHTYRLVVANDHAVTDAAYAAWLNEPEGLSDSTIFTDDEDWRGPGTYTQDSTTLVQVNNNINTVEDANNIVILSLTEYRQHFKNLWYHRNYTVTPIITT